jgi:hypothetical protein
VLTVLVFVVAASGAVLLGIAYAAVCVAFPRASQSAQPVAVAIVAGIAQREARATALAQRPCVRSKPETPVETAECGPEEL